MRRKPGQPLWGQHVLLMEEKLPESRLLGMGHAGTYRTPALWPPA